MTEANLTGADVRGANFARDALPYPIYDWAGGITLTQLYSTASYQAGDLNGIGLQLNELSNGVFVNQNLSRADFSFATIGNANFSQANLTNTNFYGATLTSANLSGADVRGANFHVASLAGANTSNLIQSDGHIVSLDATSGASLIVRDYDGNPAATPPTSPSAIIIRNESRVRSSHQPACGEIGIPVVSTTHRACDFLINDRFLDLP